MKMEAGLDTGPILRQYRIELTGQETLELVHDKLAALGAEFLPKVLKDWIGGKIEARAQDETQATYVEKLKKEDGKIDWSKSAIEIERMVHGLNPWPGTYSITSPGSLIANKTIKILAAGHEILKLNNHKTGEIFIDNNRLAIQCGQDSLLILKLQIEGGKVLDAADFLRGNQNIIGSVLE